MIREIYIGYFEDREYFLGIMPWLISICVIGLISWILIVVIDSSFMPLQNGKGQIKNKYYKSAYSYTTFHLCGKVNIPITHYVPESYNLDIMIDGISDTFKVGKNEYSFFKKGQKLNCEYTKGRLFNTIYIRSIN